MPFAKQLMKRLLPYFVTLLILILLVLLMEYFTARKEEDRQALLSYFEIDRIKEVSVGDFHFKFANKDKLHWNHIFKKEFQVDENKAIEIKKDWANIFVKEKYQNPPQNLVEYFYKNKFATLSWLNSNNEKTVWTLYPVNNETGQFWLSQEILEGSTTYYLCESEIDFDGFYQTVVEGKRLSFLHFSEYFTDPLKKWWNKSPWEGATEISLITGKSTLFSIDATTFKLKSHKTINIANKVDVAAVKNYVDLLFHLIPRDIELLSEEKLEELQATTSFYFKFENSILGNMILGISKEGFFNKENRVLFKTHINPEEKFIVLPDRFFLPGIAGLQDILLSFSQRDDTGKEFEWINVKSKQKINLSIRQIQKDKELYDFFCFFMNCPNKEDVESDTVVRARPFFKAKNADDATIKYFKSKANYILKTKNAIYYFVFSHQRVDVLEDNRVQYIFISDAIPRIPDTLK